MSDYTLLAVWSRQNIITRFIIMRRASKRLSSPITEQSNLASEGVQRNRQELELEPDLERLQDAILQRQATENSASVESPTRKRASSAELSRRTKRHKSNGWTRRRRQTKSWPARAILEENKTQYLIQYEPVDEWEKCEVSWQPKYNANPALIADWEERGILYIGGDDGAENTNVSRLRSDVSEDIDNNVPPDARSEMGRCAANSRNLHACTQEGFFQLCKSESANAEPQQPTLRGDHVTGAKDTTMLEATSTSAQESAGLRSSRVIAYDTLSDVRDATSGPPNALKLGSGQDCEKAPPRPGTTISTILSPEPSGSLDNATVAITSSPAMVEEQIAPSKTTGVQVPHRGSSSAFSVPSGKLVRARRKLRSLLHGSGTKRAKSSRSRLPPSP